jgi:hypothetical protein
LLYHPHQPLPSSKELDIGWGARTRRW